MSDFIKLHETWGEGLPVYVRPEAITLIRPCQYSCKGRTIVGAEISVSATERIRVMETCDEVLKMIEDHE